MATSSPVSGAGLMPAEPDNRTQMCRFSFVKRPFSQTSGRLWRTLRQRHLRLFADVFLTQFSALQTSRSVRTRRLAAAEGNTEVTRTARLAHIFKEIWDMITSYKGLFPCSFPVPHARTLKEHQSYELYSRRFRNLWIFYTILEKSNRICHCLCVSD